MSKVKIVGNASGSGTLTLTGPDTNSDRTITLPDATGTALMTDGSAASLTSIPAANITGTLPAISGASLTNLPVAYSSSAVICDQKAYGSVGGTFTSGAWRTRDLNTELGDVDSIVSISSNQFTLAAGTYDIFWSAPAYRVGLHLSRLYNITDSSVAEYGQTASAGGGTEPVQNLSTGMTMVTIAGSKAFEIQHRSFATKSSNGMGLAQDIEGDHQFTIVHIIKHA